MLAFLMSAVVLPAFSVSQVLGGNTKLSITNHPDAHTAPGIPLPLPEEEKEEEENRTDRADSFAFALFFIETELAPICCSGPTTWEFNHTNASALSNLPIYLGKQSLLI
jgi:hypothetical protein